MVELEPPDFRKIVTLGVEEKIVEERGRRLQRGRVAWTQAPIDFQRRLFGRIEFVLREREPERTASGLILRVEHFDLLDGVRLELLDRLLGKLFVALHQHFARGRIDYIVRRNPPHHVFERDRHFADRCLLIARTIALLNFRPSRAITSPLFGSFTSRVTRAPISCSALNSLAKRAPSKMMTSFL